ncbi:hypothetical protein WH95_18490 [Kiloniella litopenaei]|uniref:Replicative DNA helicase n=1 Tax=Kiloniella litopenaei TaxID=1549748 RepID=A0A0M2R602_9PROT|nr:replicative DNA helicase [Kiloniella litopenaei]KKJ75430.1 hypothetical protein WH95_18490 [Kiloniella litopenaei]
MHPNELPHNEEIEMAFIAALMASNKAYYYVSDTVRVEHFHFQIHADIYQVITDLINAGKQANAVTLTNYFNQHPLLTDIDVRAYLGELQSFLVTVINIKDYAEQLEDLHLRREAIRAAQEATERALSIDLEETGRDVIEGLEGRLYSIIEKGTEKKQRSTKEVAQSAFKSLEEAYKRGGEIRGLSTGFIDVDRRMGGLCQTHLIILAARPSMGKTALAINMARKIASDGIPVGVFSLEMSPEMLHDRMAADLATVDSECINQGRLNEDEFIRCRNAYRQIENLPIIIDENSAGFPVEKLAAKARWMKRKHNIKLIIVDYLQLLSARAESKVQEVTKISNTLKAIARDLDIPVLALSQLSRAVEQREDKRPQLSDLRESGSIEQDADIVAFLYRDEYYAEREKPQNNSDLKAIEAWEARKEASYGKADLIISKNRAGRVGTVGLSAQLQYMRFGNLAKEGYAA